MGEFTTGSKLQDAGEPIFLKNAAGAEVADMLHSYIMHDRPYNGMKQMDVPPVETVLISFVILSLS